MRTHIWIRKENEEAWAKIEDKSEWVNSRLGGTSYGETVLSELDDRVKGREAEVMQELADKGLIEPKIRKVEVPEIDMIRVSSEHALPPLERACCLNAKPCQHWVWNGDEQVYINSLSGRKKEV